MPTNSEKRKTKFSLAEIAKATQSKIVQGEPSQLIDGVAGPGAQATGKLVIWLSGSATKGARAQVAGGKPAALLVADEFVKEAQELAPVGCAVLQAADANYALIECLRLYKTDLVEGIASAGVSSLAKVSGKAQVAANATIGDNAEVGDNCVIGSGVFIGSGVKLGKECIIHPNAVIHRDSVLGKGVIIHSGVVIGSDGFGYKKYGAAHQHIPCSGRAIIEDDVEIGPNSTVDRGTISDTVVGAGSKIDNLCQVGHNVVIGKRCILCCGALIGGSANIGDDCVFAGKTAVADNTKVAARTTVTAASNVIRDTNEGDVISGFWGQPHKEYLKEVAMLKQLAGGKTAKAAKTPPKKDGGDKK